MKNLLLLIGSLLTLTLSSAQNYDSVNDSVLTNPNLRIRTSSREFYLGYKSPVTLKLKSGIKLKGNIIKFERDQITLANNTNVSLDEIKKIRMYPTRRWFPITTLIFVIPPIWWLSASKVASIDSPKCKKCIREIVLVNRYRSYGFGKDHCVK